MKKEGEQAGRESDEHRSEHGGCVDILVPPWELAADLAKLPLAYLSIASGAAIGTAL